MTKHRFTNSLRVRNEITAEARKLQIWASLPLVLRLAVMKEVSKIIQEVSR